MNANRFDAFSRSLAATPSRRITRRLLAGSALGSLIASGAGDTASHNALKTCKKKSGEQKKKCRRKARRHNARHTKGTAELPCTADCAGKQCGDDGCGGSCGTCGSLPCSGGSCDCTGQPDNTACGGDRQCSAQTCVSPPICAGKGENPGCTGPEPCCSDSCNPLNTDGCLCSQVNEPCHTTADCCVTPPGLACMGFRCLNTTP